MVQLRGRKHNLKKEAGLAMQEMQMASWFKELDEETKRAAIEEQKAFFTPPDAMQNTWLNIAICACKKFEEWDALARAAGWEDPHSACGVDKKDYFTSIFHIYMEAMKNVPPPEVYVSGSQGAY